MLRLNLRYLRKFTKLSIPFYVPEIFHNFFLSWGKIRRWGWGGVTTDLYSAYHLRSCHNSGTLARDREPQDCQPGSLGLALWGSRDSEPPRLKAGTLEGPTNLGTG